LNKFVCAVVSETLGWQFMVFSYCAHLLVLHPESRRQSDGKRKSL